jgi:hypothetical protein
LDENFRQDVFVSPAVIESERRERMNRILTPAATFHTPKRNDQPMPKEKNPFDNT